ncbi:MAG: cell division protein FtsZ [Bacteroidaceae bacterium]|nr:cell division protein FtsZ [Bacteroidaceae bacterium]
MNEEETLKFRNTCNVPKIIKVIGVGGGGGNAVENMYRTSIHNVSFVICNTDSQALENSPIPVKVQLGEGLGAGNNPEVARKAAENSREEIAALFDDGTKMVFITAGMGGGTGTGAAPVVAEIAKSLGILTVGIVTIPFMFEMSNKIHQALRGVTEIAKHVDALLVINNQRLLEIYPECKIKTGFKKVDEVLTVATKSIAEIITIHGIINLDFKDVEKVLKDGGVAIMSYGIDKGEQRLAGAFDKALHSPLLNNNNIYDSKKILFNIYIEPEEDEDDEAGLRVGEMEWVNNFMKRFNHDNIEVIWGMSEDETLQKGEVKVTVLATGFGMHNIPEMRPILKEDEKQKETEERNIQNMMDSFYKEEYKVYLMSDTDLDNDELISYMENSPTHKRMSRDIQNMKNISQASTTNHE